MRILFVKLGAIGDIIQSAVALTEYRARFPEVTIHWITGSSMAPLVEATGVADRVVGIDDVSLVSGSLRARACALARARVHVLRKCGSRYDGIFIGYVNQQVRMLTWGIRCGKHKTLGDRAGRPNYLIQRNRVHEYWRLLTSEDAKSIDIAAATSALGSRLFQCPEATSNAFGLHDYVVIAAGGARNLQRDDPLRRWPIQHFRQLVEQLLKNGRRVCLVGAVSDQWVSQEMHGLAVDDLIGKTTLMQLMSVMQGASAIVANDSGVFHLASLTKAGLVGLFGPTPANAVAPMGRANMRILAADNRISCSPCYDGRNFAACTRNVCLESIAVAAVLEAVMDVARSNTSTRQ